LYKWPATDLWGEETFRDLLRFVFCFFGFERARLSSDFGEIVLAFRVGFSLGISEFDKVIEQKYCVSCVLITHL
jgi:hypothetical protein